MPQPGKNRDRRLLRVSRGDLRHAFAKGLGGYRGQGEPLLKIRCRKAQVQATIFRKLLEEQR